MAMRRLTMSSPLEVRTLRLRLCLFTLVSLKFPEVLKFTSTSCGVVELGNLPRSFSGHSILIISAPRAPSQRVAHGPARTQLKSTTRIPSSARGLDKRRSPHEERWSHRLMADALLHHTACRDETHTGLRVPGQSASDR